MADMDPERADTIFGVLSHRRRRSALRVLRRHGTPITLADLADEVAVREHGLPLGEIDADDVKETYMSLYHSHLPKLTDAGVVAYDQERDLVELAGDDDEWGVLIDEVSQPRECDPEGD